LRKAQGSDNTKKKSESFWQKIKSHGKILKLNVKLLPQK
jgi:hypothetical protein